MRLFDLRSGSSVVSLYAHHLGVTAVQADDWKIVSGGDEGLVCVWDSRAGAKLWEMHNRWPHRSLGSSPCLCGEYLLLNINSHAWNALDLFLNNDILDVF